MQRHYRLTDQNFNELLERGITEGILLKNVQHFTPEECRVNLLDFNLAPVSKISLMFFIDRFGDFTSVKPSSAKPHFLIAMAVFKSLDSKDQMDVLEYLNFSTNEDD